VSGSEPSVWDGVDGVDGPVTVAPLFVLRLHISPAGNVRQGGGGWPVVLVNHFPLIREPTQVLRYPEFAQWCGTERTADWHVRFNAAAVVYGHLHIPRTIWHDGVRFAEVSLGYPREWRRRGQPPGLRQILSVPGSTARYP
jgi:hypothetical protein